MTEHSIVGESWLTKLERIAELAKREKETVFNNLGHCIDLELLWRIYTETMEKSYIRTFGI